MKFAHRQPLPGGFMLSRTSFLGRLFGVYFILFAAIMFLRKQAILDGITGALSNPGIMLTFGVILLFAGLAMVLGHNLWSGGVLPVVVTLIGYLTALKGLLILLLPPDTGTEAYLRALHYEQYFYVYAAFTLCLGLCLTILSFRAPSR